MRQESKPTSATRIITLSVGACLLVGTWARAGPVRSFSELKALLRPGETLHVQDTGDQEWTGSLVEVTDSVIVLTALGVRREFDRGTVLRVEKDGDSVRNGALWGALFGLLPSQGCPRPRVPCVVGSLAFWSGIGALVDRSRRGRTVVYEATLAP